MRKERGGQHRMGWGGGLHEAWGEDCSGGRGDRLGEGVGEDGGVRCNWRLSRNDCNPPPIPAS